MLAARKKANSILAAILIPLTLLTLVAMALHVALGKQRGHHAGQPLRGRAGGHV